MSGDMNYFEISRFTYFYKTGESLKSYRSQNRQQYSTQKWTEISERVEIRGNIDNVLPFSKNLQKFWIELCDSKQTKEQDKDDFWHQVFIHSFPIPEKSIFIFEIKLKIPFDKFKEGIEKIKQDRKDVFLEIIHSINPHWEGEYSADNDFFYFINLKVDTVFKDIEDITQRNKKIASYVKDKLNIDNTCIFTHLGFTDKNFPRLSRIEDDLEFVIKNEKQPLVVISPAIDANKFLIPDEKLFIRCYVEDNISLPIRLVLKTLIFQKAFIEYASTASVNITENRKTNISYINLSKAFSKFIDYLWRVEISNSFYLNKSYRIIKKIWLLNEKYEVLKDHIDRNAIFEDRENQGKFASIAQIIIIVLGIYTIISGVNDFDQLLQPIWEGRSMIFHIAIDTLFAFLGLGTLTYVLIKLNKMRS